MIEQRLKVSQKAILERVSQSFSKYGIRCGGGIYTCPPFESHLSNHIGTFAQETRDKFNKKLQPIADPNSEFFEDFVSVAVYIAGKATNMFGSKKTSFNVQLNFDERTKVIHPTIWIGYKGMRSFEPLCAICLVKTPDSDKLSLIGSVYYHKLGLKLLKTI